MKTKPHTAGHTNGIRNGHGAAILLSRAEIVERLEHGAKKRCGMSARVLLRRYHCGKLTNPSRVSDLISLSNLLRKNDPLFSE